MKTLKFYLLGKCDNSNPSSISLEQIKQWEEEGWVTYLGEQSDIREIVAKSSCVVLPSYKEGIPRVLLEAMSMEKPIITTEVSGCKECILDPLPKDVLKVGKNGILIPPKDSKSLALAIQTLSQLPLAKLRTMGKQGRIYAQARFEVQKTITFYRAKVHQFASNTSKHLTFVSNSIFSMLNFRLEVLLSLQQEGYHIHILAPEDSLATKLKDLGFSFHPICVNSKGLNPFEDAKLCFSLYQILKSIRPALVFSYTIKPAIYGSIASNLLKLPNFAIITGLGYVFIAGGWKKKILKSLVILLYRLSFWRTQEVWFLNQDDQDCFTSLAIISHSKAQILDGEGINTKYFAPQKQEEQEEFIFLLVARMLWDKGVGELIEAIKLLKQT